MSLNKKTMLTTSLIGATVLAAAVAQASPPAPSASAKKPAQSEPARPSFSELDRNHDGRITRSEIPHSMHALRIHFMQYDVDGNGSLSEKEYEVYEHPPTYERRP